MKKYSLRWRLLGMKFILEISIIFKLFEGVLIKFKLIGGLELKFKLRF